MTKIESMTSSSSVQKNNTATSTSTTVKEILYKNLASFGVDAEAVRQMDLEEAILIDYTRRIANLYMEARERDFAQAKAAGVSAKDMTLL